MIRRTNLKAHKEYSQEVETVLFMRIEVQVSWGDTNRVRINSRRLTKTLDLSLWFAPDTVTDLRITAAHVTRVINMIYVFIACMRRYKHRILEFTARHIFTCNSKNVYTIIQRMQTSIYRGFLLSVLHYHARAHI